VLSAIRRRAARTAPSIRSPVPAGSPGREHSSESVWDEGNRARCPTCSRRLQNR
jgi:hypothetical protein